MYATPASLLSGEWRSLDADVRGCFQHKYDYIATRSIKLSFREYLGHDIFSRSSSCLQSTKSNNEV